jgi:hypothetical protein
MALVRTDVSEHCIAFMIRVKKSVTLLGLRLYRSSEPSVLTRAAWHHIPEEDILHNHRRENLKSYIALTGWAL